MKPVVLFWVFLVLLVISLIGFSVAVSQPVAMSAGPDGTVSPASDATLSFTTLFFGLFSASTVGTVLTWWKNHQATVATVVHTIAPGVPVPPADIGQSAADAVELAAAVTWYLNHKDDESAKRRFVVAALTEVGDIMPAEVHGPLSELSSAITSFWFPGTKGA